LVVASGGQPDRELLDADRMTLHSRFRPSFRGVTRSLTALLLAILAGAIAVTVTGCEQDHRDMYFGTDAGEGFDAPAREVRPDDAGDAGGVTPGADGAAETDGGAGDDAGGAAGTGG